MEIPFLMKINASIFITYMVDISLLCLTRTFGQEKEPSVNENVQYWPNKTNSTSLSSRKDLTE